VRGRVFAFIVTLSLSGMLAGPVDEPRIFYSRELPGAYPPYVQIVVHYDGRAVYRESVDDPDDEPVEFRLRPSEVREIFHLAEKLDRFRKPLESNLKVANMGLKTFRWEQGNERYEQKFNFSKNADARLLADWFARITETIRHRVNLERTARFDKLGVNKVLLQLQISMERKRLVAADQFLPLLDKIASDEAILNMARSRAAMLARVIRGSAEGGK